jgi:hypothetical protein
MATTKTEKKAALILDTHRGVYYGRIVKIKDKGRTVELDGMRHAFYWSAGEDGEKGVYSLATVGPQPGSKIGPRVHAIVYDVAKIVDVSAKAIAAWEAATW